MKRIIPGHLRAYTSWVILLFVTVTLFVTRNGIQTFGVLCLLFGLFIGDQATHLAQADHSAPPPTSLERGLQQNRGLFVLSGTTLALWGLLMIIACPS